MTSEVLCLLKTPDEFVYSTDEAYQQLFQELFMVDMTRLEEIADVYDVEQVKIGMNYILSKTCQIDDWWKRIFTQAAAMFLSEDPELGLCVCLNFSYLDAFYKVFYCMEKDPDHAQYAVWKTELEARLC